MSSQKGHRQEGSQGHGASGVWPSLGCPPVDTALVSSGIDFTGVTVGLAKVSAMCSRHSGAVNQVRRARPSWGARLRA